MTSQSVYLFRRVDPGRTPQSITQLKHLSPTRSNLALALDRIVHGAHLARLAYLDPLPYLAPAILLRSRCTLFAGESMLPHLPGRGTHLKSKVSEKLRRVSYSMSGSLTSRKPEEWDCIVVFPREGTGPVRIAHWVQGKQCEEQTDLGPKQPILVEIEDF